MPFYDSVAAFTERIKTLKPHITSEEATKTALIMPFFQQILGWDVFNPQEFAPEYKANFQSSGNDRVDFAVLVGGKPVMLIEAKYVMEPLEQHVGQLAKYYAPTEAKFAVLTNGVTYRFFSDVEKENIMDDTPFLDIDLLALDKRAVTELERFHKERFEYDSAAVRAFELLHENAIYARLSREIENPSDTFIRLLSAGPVPSLEKLRSITKSAILRYITDNAVEVTAAPASQEESSLDAPIAGEDFTVSQLEAMEDVKALITSTGSKHRYKVKFYSRKKHCEVAYRNCTVCNFPRGEDNDVTSIRFLGTTVETRKNITESPLSDAAAVESFAPQIIKQCEFIDWWYLNPKAETGGIE